MLKAAGILMFIGAFLGVMVLHALELTRLLSALWIGFMVLGGFYTLKRENWRLCLISSILLLPLCLALLFLMIWAGADALRSGEEFNVPFVLAMILFFLMIGILPVTVVILRKRDWHSGHKKVRKAEN